MKNTPHSSIDGFISRRPSDRIGETRHQLGKVNPTTELAASKKYKKETILPKPINLQSEIDQSLQQIDDEKTEKPKKRGFFRRHHRKPKKPITKARRILRRIKWALIIIIIVAIGYFGWKFIVTSGNMFNGNIIGLFQHKKLKQDANGRTNILIFGTSGYSMNQDNGWDGAFLTDSIMVVSVDQSGGNGYTISLPRDLYVEHTCANTLGTTSGKLNETFYCAYNDNNKSEKLGAKALMKTASTITGLDIQYYVHADWTAFKKSIDAVGGVNIKIESEDPRGIYDVATGINYKNGEIVNLNGEQALALARARNSHGGYGLAGGNFDREKNQQKLLSALQKKVVSVGTLTNPVAVSNLMDAMGENLKTNFETDEIQAVIDITKKSEKMKALPLVGRKDAPDLVTTGMYNGASIVQPTAGLFNYTEIIAYIKKSVLSDRLAKLDVLNGSKQEGLASEKAKILEAAGYRIGNVANAPSKTDVPVIIYQINESKQRAAKVLADKYGVEVKIGTPEGYKPNKGSDFVIIFSK